MKNKLIYIEWADAYSSNYDEWRTIDECLEWADDYKWIVKQIGWILEETKHYILLASKKNDIGQDAEPQYSLLTKIPKTWIKYKKVIQT